MDRRRLGESDLWRWVRHCTLKQKMKRCHKSAGDVTSCVYVCLAAELWSGQGRTVQKATRLACATTKNRWPPARSQYSRHTTVSSNLKSVAECNRQQHSRRNRFSVSLQWDSQKWAVECRLRRDQRARHVGERVSRRIQWINLWTFLLNKLEGCV